jgi:hypothetical protein
MRRSTTRLMFPLLLANSFVGLIGAWVASKYDHNLVFVWLWGAAASFCGASAVLTYMLGWGTVKWRSNRPYSWDFLKHLRAGTPVQRKTHKG